MDTLGVRPRFKIQANFLKKAALVTSRFMMIPYLTVPQNTKTRFLHILFKTVSTRGYLGKRS